jgi:hypothetical protein
MAPTPQVSERISEAQKVATTDPAKAESVYKDVLKDGPGQGEAALRDYEASLMGLGELYRDQKKTNELSELVKESRSTLSSFAKAKTAKIGKSILDSHEGPILTSCPQSGNSSISSLRYPTRFPSRSPPQSRV